MRLWTNQSNLSISELETTGVLRANWQRYPPNDGFRLAYAWMCTRMEKSNLPCKGHAPVWAWHSCGGFGKPPALRDARALLSDLELENGVQTIELDCPDDCALLSMYGVWNTILDAFMDRSSDTVIGKRLERQLFKIRPEKIGEFDAVQASLPLIKKEWVLDIRPLKLPVGSFDFDPDAEI
ncbi:MAG: DUF3841 domain-containing protein [Saprospiraceae bacterium]|nr:DUF3841 domain-containing protein [Lewinellaceae bacterium]